MKKIKHSRFNKFGCGGLTNKQVWEMCEKKYIDFCHYRGDIHFLLPAMRSNLFTPRVMRNEVFEIE